MVWIVFCQVLAWLIIYLLYYPHKFVAAAQNVCYPLRMDKLNVEQAGRLGGKKRWSKVDKTTRSAFMKAVADARWEKYRALKSKQS